MNDNDIIKALKCCSIGDKCFWCPMLGKKDCMKKLYRLALELIDHQKDEIERIYKSLNLTQQEQYINGRNDGIKEFAERLNKQAFCVQQTEWEGRVVDCEDIDALVKEMTEEK